MILWPCGSYMFSQCCFNLVFSHPCFLIFNNKIKGSCHHFLEHCLISIILTEPEVAPNGEKIHFLSSPLVSSPSLHCVPTLHCSFLWCSWRNTHLSAQTHISSPPAAPPHLHVHDPWTESWLDESHCLLSHVTLSAKTDKYLFSSTL